MAAGSAGAAGKGTHADNCHATIPSPMLLPPPMPPPSMLLPPPCCHSTHADAAACSSFIEEDTIWRILAQIVMGLKECHRRSDKGVVKPIIHRDIKPGALVGERRAAGGRGHHLTHTKAISSLTAVGTSSWATSA